MGLIKLAAVGAVLLWANAARAGDVEVRVATVGNSQGVVRAQLCQPTEWLKNGCALSGEAPAQPGVTVVTVHGVPPGTWAVVAFHDKKNSGGVALSLLGIPVEGVGFSNNAPLGLHGPRYGDAAVLIGPEGAVVDTKLHFE